MTDQNPQPEDTQPTDEQLSAGDLDALDEQNISNLPVETEERRKLAETMQSLHYQHGATEADAE